MTVYTAGWVAHTVNIQSSGSSVFLGAIINMDNSGTDTAAWLLNTAHLARSAVLSKHGFSCASKVAVISTSTINGMVYKAATSVLSHSQLQDIDTIIDSIMVDSTKNMNSFPRKLIHIDRRYGGLGITCFSVQADSRKIQKLFGCLRSQQTQSMAAKGLLSRLARKHGYHSSPQQRLVITPAPSNRRTRKMFLDGPLEMLQSHGLYICRAGISDSPQELTCLLPVLIPKEDNELRQFCIDNNFMNISDITVSINMKREWYLEGPLELLRPYLPILPPTGQSPLLTGQYWKLQHQLRTYNLQINDVIRIDGVYCGKVVVTRYKRTAMANRVRHCECQIQVPQQFLFQPEYAIRCSLSHVSDDIFSIQYPRLQPRPDWASIPEASPPSWIQWITAKLTTLSDNYSPRPYTDGSWDSPAHLQSYFRPDISRTTSSAAIIIKDDSKDWMELPVLAIYIKDGQDLECESVYSMEFLALAGALQMTVFNLDKLHATASDAQGVLKLLSHRRHHLQQVLKDHHFLLQCIDNSLFKGAPMPYHVRVHHI